MALRSVTSFWWKVCQVRVYRENTSSQIRFPLPAKIQPPADGKKNRSCPLRPLACVCVCVFVFIDHSDRRYNILYVSCSSDPLSPLGSGRRLMDSYNRPWRGPGDLSGPLQRRLCLILWSPWLGHSSRLLHPVLFGLFFGLVPIAIRPR